MSRIEEQHSAGGLVMERGRVLLIRTRTMRGKSVWTLPKGRIEPGEEALEAALREVREETGYSCRLKRRLPTTTYRFRRDTVRIHKTVEWYLLEPVRKAGRHDPREVDEVRWVPVREAFSKLSYQSDRTLLKRVTAPVEKKKLTQKQDAREAER